VRSQLGFKEVRGKVYSDFEELHKWLLSRPPKDLGILVPDLPPKKPPGDKKQVHCLQSVPECMSISGQNEAFDAQAQTRLLLPLCRPGSFLHSPRKIDSTCR
jgi:hypothetical protein